MLPCLVWNWLYRPGWPWTCATSASAYQVQALKAWITVWLQENLYLLYCYHSDFLKMLIFITAFQSTDEDKEKETAWKAIGISSLSLRKAQRYRRKGSPGLFYSVGRVWEVSVLSLLSPSALTSSIPSPKAGSMTAEWSILTRYLATHLHPHLQGFSTSTKRVLGICSLKRELCDLSF